ncbi:Type-1 restriction enzyme EcoKI specificity protein [Anoxybacillus sp. P3H1B]|uniref:restriction endonuclease subunit S n=1 Tax=Anoxybacillus sp. P3H1B TaxID=1769293 RepID=UPI00079AF334|nr:restriction endonuclease subunit S [Anoxybacillus sp. P3H1B]KXG09098.1 Type-1 restriction enzyme EcoKI specificity protein [Anoxybacillus sp. P3H1B]
MSKTKQKSIDELLEEALVPEDEQPYQVPGNWVWVRLKSINKNEKRNIEPRNYEEEVFELYSVPNYDLDEPEYIKGKEIGSNKQIVKENEILLCKINPRINRVWMVSNNKGKYRKLASTEWIVISENEAIYPKYLLFLLKAPYFRKLITSNVSGVGGSLTRARPKEVELYPIALPPLNEQERIAEKIERLFAKIDEAKRLIEEVKESVELRRAAILEKAFRGELTKKWRQQNNVQQSAEEWLEEILNLKNTKTNKFNDQLDPAILDKLFELPEGWKWIRLNDLIESSVYGTSAKATDDSSGIPVLRMGNIVDGSIQFTDLKYLSNEHIDVQKLGLEVDDLLFNRTNSYELVGKTALVDESIAGQATFASYLIRVRLFYKDILAFYVCHYINSHIGRNILLSMVTQQVGQANINSQKLASLPIPLPPREEIVEISKYLSYYREKEEQLKNILSIEAKIESLKHSILSKAFRGELGTNDPNDEHAIELLKEVLKSK